MRAHEAVLYKMSSQILVEASRLRLWNRFFLVPACPVRLFPCCLGLKNKFLYPIPAIGWPQIRCFDFLLLHLTFRATYFGVASFRCQCKPPPLGTKADSLPPNTRFGENSLRSPWSLSYSVVRNGSQKKNTKHCFTLGSETQSFSSKTRLKTERKQCLLGLQQVIPA